MSTLPIILVVDDDPAALAATVRMLSRDGYDVVEAVDGRRAIDAAKRHRPSLVLLDLELPDMSGIDVLHTIRSSRELESTRVVMLSAHREPEAQADGLDSGADGYLTRPISSTELLAAVRAHLRQQELTERLRASEARFRELITRQADGVLVVDRAGNVRFVNLAAESLFRRPASELMGQPFGFPVESDVPQQLMLHPVGGAPIFAEMRVATTEWEGEPAWIISLHDVTARVRMEEQLRAEQRRTRLILDSVAEGIQGLDREGRVVVVNPAAVRMLGYGGESQLLERMAHEAIHHHRADGSVYPPEECPIHRTLRDGVPCAVTDEVFFRLDGTSFPVEYACVPQKHEHGDIFGAVVTFRDVADARAAEDNLRQQTALLDNAQRGAGIGTWNFDVTTGRLHWSDSTCSLFGIRPPEFRGTYDHFIGFVVPEDREPLSRTLYENARGDHGLFEFEYRIRRGDDGKVRWIYERGQVETDGAGRVTRRLGIVMDVTERKLAEQDRQSLLARERMAQALRRIAGRAARIGGWSVTVPEMELTWSDETAELHGEPPGFVPDVETAILYYAPDDRETIRDAVACCIRQGVPFDVEARLVTARGEEIWVRSIGEATRDEQGTIVSIQGAIQDISPLKRVEAEMSSLGRRLTTTLESMPEGFIIIDRENFRVLYWNAEAESLLGTKRADAIGRSLWDLHPDAVGSEFDLQYRRALAENCSVEFEALYSGLDMWIEVRAYPSREGLSIYFRDVTRERENRDALRESEERFRTLVEMAPEAVFVQTNSRFAYVNAAAVRLFGAESPQDLVGQPVVDRFHPDFRDVVRERIRSLNDERMSVPAADESIVTSTGETRHVNVSAVPFEYEGIPGALVFVRDITERRLLEQQFLRAQRMESIGTLAGGIAHDLNNVLAPITMGVALLRGALLDDRGIRIVDNIERAAKRGADLVRQVLTFARGVEGVRSTLDVRHIIGEVEAIMVATFPRNITLTTSVASELYPVLGDPTQLNQVLLNLCVNARDAMPEGGVLHVTACNREIDEQYAIMDKSVRPGRYVVIDVADTGTGMPPQVVDRIFDPFFTTKELGKGTGLGLPTALGIVRSHGGFANVYSEVGHGSTFRVHLPAAELQELVAAGTEVEQLPRGDGELVLVVDDEPTILEITRQTLEAFGYRVLTAEDGAQALAIYAPRMAEVAVVLTDMMMPVMDGAALIAALRRMNPEVRIIASSGLTTHGMVGRATHAGVNGFLHKPYSADAVLKALREAISDG